VTYQSVVDVLKSELKRRGFTYARLGEAIGLSESGVKKIMSADDGSFARLAQICSALDLELPDVLASVDASPGPWRLTADQEELFVRDPDCWWFLGALSRAGWDLARAIDGHELPPARVEGWLAALERRGVLRRTASGRIVPGDAARQPWQAGARFGRAVVAPAQDALVAHARHQLADPSAAPIRGGVECGFARMALHPDTVKELKQALRDVVAEFARRSRREAVVRDGSSQVPVGVMTVSAPFPLGRPGGAMSHSG